MGTDHHLPLDTGDAAQRRTLLQIFLLNAGLAAALLAGGLAADSSGLLANALDNTSDAVAYALSFVSVARAQPWKARAAAVTGVMLLVLAAGVTADSVRRFLTGSEPLGLVMIAMAFIAAAINALCIKLLRRHQRADVNLRAAWTMSINDFISNFGIVIAGALVLLLGRNWPDLAAGIAIAAVASYGGVMTLRDAFRNRSEGTDNARAGHSHD